MTLSCTEKQTFFYFKDSSVEIAKGESLQLDIVSSGMEETMIQWSSSDTEIAEVDAGGVVIGKEYGEAVVTASCGDYQSMCRINVVKASVSEVSLSDDDIELALSETIKLSYSIVPEDADESSLIWTSSDENVATVDGTGTVKALAEGEAMITVKALENEAVCRIKVVNEVHIGDFYYSDGTFSRALDESKEVIGVVFWTGNPTASDETLSKDCPDCSNGLVVAVNDLDGEYEWQEASSSYSATVSEWTEENTDCFSLIAGMQLGDYVNKIVGYNNTKAIKAFNAAAENTSWKVSAVEALKEFENSNIAPDGTSGWYIPSAKELSLLCTGTFNASIFEIGTVMVDNRDLVNESLSQIDGADKLLSSAYWSSSEADANTAVTVFFGSGVVVNGQKRNLAKARCVLAF